MAFIYRSGSRLARSTPHAEARDYGVYFIFKSMEQGRTFRITVPKLPKYPTRDPNHRILEHQRSRFTHYYFLHSGMRCWGRPSSRVASFPPFPATYWLNGQSFIERELEQAGIGFHKNDYAFLAVDQLAALQCRRRPPEPSHYP
jgi:hypothetical protein